MGQRHRRRANINPALVQSIVTVGLSRACMHPQNEVLIRTECLLASTGEATLAQHSTDIGSVSACNRRQTSCYSQQTQNICKTFVQRWPNVFDVGRTLYKCYTNVLCLLGQRRRRWAALNQHLVDVVLAGCVDKHQNRIINSLNTYSLDCPQEPFNNINYN